MFETGYARRVHIKERDKWVHEKRMRWGKESSLSGRSKNMVFNKFHDVIFLFMMLISKYSFDRFLNCSHIKRSCWFDMDPSLLLLYSPLHKSYSSLIWILLSCFSTLHFIRVTVPDWSLSPVRTELRPQGQFLLNGYNQRLQTTFILPAGDDEKGLPCRRRDPPYSRVIQLLLFTFLRVIMTWNESKNPTYGKNCLQVKTRQNKRKEIRPGQIINSILCNIIPPESHPGNLFPIHRIFVD